jgi:hypothetical protein
MKSRNKKTFYLILIILVILVLGVALFFIFNKYTISNLIQSHENNVVNFETIKTRTPSIHIEKKNYVIENNQDWQSLWNKMDLKELNEVAKPSAPEVDFSKNMVIAIFQGTKSTGGYSIEITKIIETKDALEIYITEKSPGKNCIVTQAFTSPYQIIKIPKINKKVIFKPEQKTTDCR